MPQRLSRTTINFTPNLRPDGLTSSIIESSVRSRSVADPDNQRTDFSMFGGRFGAPFDLGSKARRISSYCGCFLLHYLGAVANPKRSTQTGIRRTWNWRSSIARKVCPDLIRKGNTSRLLAGIDATRVNFGGFAGRSVILTASVSPDDTCAAWFETT
jgi:hypothetical protein